MSLYAESTPSALGTVWAAVTGILGFHVTVSASATDLGWHAAHLLLIKLAMCLLQLQMHVSSQTGKLMACRKECLQQQLVHIQSFSDADAAETGRKSVGMDVGMPHGTVHCALCG